MGIAWWLCEERVFPGGVTGDRFPRRENLMEKSEVSDTDAPAIRQAIHGSSFRAFLFAARRGEARREGDARPGVRCTPEVTFVCWWTIAAARIYATRTSVYGGFQKSGTPPRRGGSRRAEIFRASCTHCRPVRPARDAPCKFSLTERREKELNRPLKVNQPAVRPTDQLALSDKRLDLVAAYFRRRPIQSMWRAARVESIIKDL